MRYCGPFHRYSSICFTVFVFSLVYLLIYKVTLRTKALIIPYNYDNLSQQDVDLNGNPLPDRPAVDKNETDTIYIAIASCEETGVDVNLTQTKRKTMTLIKSILISASIDHVPHIQLHFITNTDNLLKFYNETITKIANMSSSTKLDVTFHSTNKSLPVQHKNFWMTNFNLCSHARLFLPSILPQVTKIVYLDTDTLITGSIQRIWKLFEKMNATHAIGMGQNNETEDTNNGESDKKTFPVLQFVLPKGINSGVLLMHLEKLRQFQWNNKVTSTLNKYIKVLPSDQQIINCILHEHPEILQIIPCNFNFMHIHCDKGLTCKASLEDPIGIHLIHGLGEKFDNDSNPIYKIFELYKKADMKSEFKNSLFLPIKKIYTDETVNSTCFGRLGPLLYKNIVVDGSHTKH